MKRKSTDLEIDVFLFLNELRESGSINMFGARPYIMSEFEMDEKEAKRILMLWMKNFNKEGNYEEITDEAVVSQS